MPTKMPRVTFSLPTVLHSKIVDFQHENRCKNQTQAILSLIEKGFESIKSSEEHSVSKENRYLLAGVELSRLSEAMAQLNGEGREKVVEYAEDLAAGGRYKKINQHSMGKEA